VKMAIKDLQAKREAAAAEGAAPADAAAAAQ
jgi:hypothetical protein